MRVLLACLICATFLATSARTEEGDVFDRLDTNSDGNITANEIDDAKKRLFNRLLRTSDNNKDGKISKEEFSAGTASTRPNRDTPAQPAGRRRFDPEQLYNRIDQNGDGNVSKEEAPMYLHAALKKADTDGKEGVSREEFVKHFPDLARVIQSKLNEAKPNELIAKAGKIFEKQDANSDGKLTIDEIPEDRRKEFQKALDKFDTDNDGGLNLAQFKQAIAALPKPNPKKPQTPSIAAVVKRLKQADQNNDGKLSKEEAPERIKQNFDRIDANGDGQLDREELEKMIRRFQQQRPK